MSRTLQVKTFALNTILDKDSWVYVKVGESYIRKKAKDLQEGDLLVVKT